MYTVEYSPLYLRITRGDVSIQFTHETNEVTLEWIHPYTAWTDWQPEGVAHHHLRYALGVLRGRMPSICTVTAYDTTAFLCPTPGGDFLVPLAPFYLAFHGKTWYESCTDATHDLITRSRLDDPAFKSIHLSVLNGPIHHWQIFSIPCMIPLLHGRPSFKPFRLNGRLICVA